MMMCYPDIEVERLRLELREAKLANERKRYEWPEENAVEVIIKNESKAKD